MRYAIVKLESYLVNSHMPTNPDNVTTERQSVEILGTAWTLWGAQRSASRSDEWIRRSGRCGGYYIQIWDRHIAKEAVRSQTHQYTVKRK